MKKNTFTAFKDGEIKKEFFIKINMISCASAGNQSMSEEDRNLIGCCGAYCKTCREYFKKRCKGCKTGYIDGSRDINKAKCKIKICCLKIKFCSCSDCKKNQFCQTLNSFYKKNGYKYRKYQEAINFIMRNGYENFVVIANKWNEQYGKYE
jgi:hypothetical protein